MTVFERSVRGERVPITERLYVRWYGKKELPKLPVAGRIDLSVSVGP